MSFFWQKLLHQIFPLQCLHCHHSIYDFPKTFCKSCIDLTLSFSSSSLDHGCFDIESPFYSLWKMYKQTSFKRYLKDCAAFVAIRLSYLDKKFSLISFLETNEYPRRQILEELSVEIARFYGMKHEQYFYYEIEEEVFDKHGNILSQIKELNKVVDEKILVICEDLKQIPADFLEKKKSLGFVFISLF